MIVFADPCRRRCSWWLDELTRLTAGPRRAYQLAGTRARTRTPTQPPLSHGAGAAPLSRRAVVPRGNCIIHRLCLFGAGVITGAPMTPARALGASGGRDACRGLVAPASVLGAGRLKELEMFGRAGSPGRHLSDSPRAAAAESDNNWADASQLLTPPPPLSLHSTEPRGAQNRFLGLPVGARLNLSGSRTQSSF